jgi:hypothetical protein
MAKKWSGVDEKHSGFGKSDSAARGNKQQRVSDEGNAINTPASLTLGQSAT